VEFGVDLFPSLQPKRISSSAIVLNSWQHVAATWDGSPSGSGIHLYVNGVLAEGGGVTNGAGTPISDSATPLSIGNRTADFARAFDGLVDEVRVYRGVLTAAEIRALANSADTQAPGVPTGLTATRFSGSQADIGWSPSADNVAVTGYQLERCAGVS